MLSDDESINNIDQFSMLRTKCKIRSTWDSLELPSFLLKNPDIVHMEEESILNIQKLKGEFKEPPNKCDCKIVKRALRFIRYRRKSLTTIVYHTIRDMCDHNTNIDSMLSRDSRLLQIAVKFDNIVLLRMLISYDLFGIYPNLKDYMGQTPLHYAVSANRKEMIRLLIKRGANPNSCDNQGISPLRLALETGKSDIMRLILNCSEKKPQKKEKKQSSLVLLATRTLNVITMLQDKRDLLEYKRKTYAVIQDLTKRFQDRKHNKQVDVMTDFCSRLSLANTSDEVEDNVKALIESIKNVNITE